MNCRKCDKSKLMVYSVRNYPNKMIRYVKCTECGNKDIQIVLYIDKVKNLNSFYKAVKKEVKIMDEIK